MLRQFCIDARFFLFFISGATLFAGDGLKLAWIQALYAVEPNSATEFSAQNAAQNLKLSFGSSGTRLTHGDAALTFRLVGYGRGANIQAPGSPSIAATRNRVEYRHAALTEWYVNEERGLEQGFTLSAPPASSASGSLLAGENACPTASQRGAGAFACQPIFHNSLVLALGVTGALHPELRSSREVALLDSRGQAVLRYGDLHAWDARGQKLASRFRVEGGQVHLVVEDSGAVYPITIDPTVTQIVLNPSDGASSARLGQSVAIDGNTAVVGAPSEGGLTGAAYVFVLSGVTWIQQAKLTASDGASGDQFGSSVSLFGGSVVIGAPGNSTQGAAYVFTTDGFTWTQQAKLTASDVPRRRRGSRLCISLPILTLQRNRECRKLRAHGCAGINRQHVRNQLCEFAWRPQRRCSCRSVRRRPLRCSGALPLRNSVRLDT